MIGEEFPEELHVVVGIFQFMVVDGACLSHCLAQGRKVDACQMVGMIEHLGFLEIEGGQAEVADIGTAGDASQDGNDGGHRFGFQDGEVIVAGGEIHQDSQGLARVAKSQCDEHTRPARLRRSQST